MGLWRLGNHTHLWKLGGQRRRLSGDPYAEDTGLVLTYRVGVLVSLASGVPEGCVSLTSVWWTQMQTPMRG